MHFRRSLYHRLTNDTIYSTDQLTGHFDSCHVLAKSWPSSRNDRRLAAESPTVS